MEKQKLLVSFSGGETSAYMCYYLKTHLANKYDMIFVFANTGEENEETLNFANKIDVLFELNLVWVEPVISMTGATKHKVVNYKTAERSGIGGNFEKMIQRFGMPNPQNSICTRELKERPITSYARSIGWKKRDYLTAIGIRVDEIDRVSKNYKKNRLIYPLVDALKTKQHVNLFMESLPFRLNLKGYEGNCKWCWKKSHRKLATIYKHNPERFDFPLLMEKKYSFFTANRNPEKFETPIKFFWHKKSVFDIAMLANSANFQEATDDRYLFEIQEKIDFETDCGASCEVFNH